MIIVYSLPDCLRCQEIKEKLESYGYEYEERQMDTAENLTDLTMLNCFCREAPVVRVDDTCFEYCDCQEENFFTSLFHMHTDNTKEIPEIEETHRAL